MANDPQLKEADFDVLGMTCLSCADSAQKALCRVPGVAAAQVNFAGRSAHVRYDGQPTTIQQMSTALAQAGYTLVADKAKLQDAEQHYLADLRLRVVVALIFSLPLLVLSMFFHHSLPHQGWIELVLTLPVVLYAGRSFYINALKQALRAEMTMDTLVALGTGAAFVVAVVNVVLPHGPLAGMPIHFESAAVVLAFILTGNLIEETAKRRTDDALQGLGGLLPARATRLTLQGSEQVAPEAIQTGDRLLVRPGERVPVDGTVWQGETHVDESMLSGESVPVHKRKPDLLMAGTLNQEGEVQMIATQVGEGTVLSRIMAEVRSAQGSRPPAQRLADRIAAVFVPIVLLLALAVGAAWAWVLPGGSLEIGVYTALTVLVVSCPCALGLATPVAVKVGIGTATRQGILVRNATALEVAAEIDTIAFDKTGTLTLGKPRVYGAEYEPEMAGAAGTYIGLLAATVAESAHPLSKAVGTYLRTIAQPNRLPDRLEQLGGKGVEAQYGTTVVRVGRMGWLQELGCSLSPALEKHQHDYQNQGYSIVAAAIDQQVFALFALADQLKPEAADVLGALRREGVQILMLTGDHPQAAARVAAELNIDQWHAGLLPQDKAAHLQQLAREGRKAAMVGDGLNDAVAFAAARLPIAMGGGVEAAIRSADVALLHGDLRLLPRLRSLSRSTRAIIRQNLAWAFAYNLITIPLAAGLLYPLLLSPTVAGGLMALSSLTVVLNSLRLKKKS